MEEIQQRERERERERGREREGKRERESDIKGKTYEVTTQRSRRERREGAR